MSVTATYRLQFHKDFTFADAERIVPYLAEIGVSHLYASPITTAQPGSTHGYDVADPTRINPELGGEHAFRSLAAALRAKGLGIIIDIVPNHMGVAGSTNRWWMDVLENGPASEYAKFFDIDWRERLLLPFLGEPLPDALANGALRLRYDEAKNSLAAVAYNTHHFPIRREDHAEVLRWGLDAYDPADREGQERLGALLDRQHYRLAWWRVGNDELNWRRFFTITELAGLRAEDPAVFEATHQLYFRLYSEGLIDGLRIDHVDGLTDPAGYCRRLRERLSDLESQRPANLPKPAYIVVEKILAYDEPLATDWGVDGTSGYDFMAEASALLHDPTGEKPLNLQWKAVSGRTADFREEELQARQDMLSWEFEGQLASCVRAFVSLAHSAPETRAITEGMLRRAVERLLWAFPVYRTYGTGTDAPASDARIRRATLAKAAAFLPPGERNIAELVLSWLAGEGPGDPSLTAEAVRRFQQLSAPIAAKAVEDTAFYRYGRLLSRNDVGFDPSRFAMSIPEFHQRMTQRSTDFPRSMLATATHDHKRGEDVRARLAVISEIPGEWIEAFERWTKINAQAAEGVDPADAYQLYQMLLGAWPGSKADLAEFRDRIAAWQQKALREAKLCSSWAEPDEAYEGRARAFLETILDPSASAEFLNELSTFAERLRPAGEANSLVQTFLRYTVPGIPDLYQGTEFEDLSLVDPDNRRPVDFAARQRALGSSGDDSFNAPKQALIARLLELRGQHSALFSKGSYEPIPVEGARMENVLAFARRNTDGLLVAAAALHCGRAIFLGGGTMPGAEFWGDTRLNLPSGSMPAAELFTDAPVYVSIA